MRASAFAVHRSSPNSEKRLILFNCDEVSILFLLRRQGDVIYGANHTGRTTRPVIRTGTRASVATGQHLFNNNLNVVVSVSEIVLL